MSDLVSRVLAAIEQAERSAQCVPEEKRIWVAQHSRLEGSAVMDDDGWPLMKPVFSSMVDHIARNDPAAVLRRTQADKRQVARHHPERRSGYQPDDDDTPGAYGIISQACAECGSQDLAVHWPCPTLLDVAFSYGISVEEETT